MEIYLILIVLMVLFTIACYLDSKPTWIPMIVTDEPLAVNLREIPYNINPSKLKYLNKDGIEISPEGFEFYIVGGNAFKDKILKNGRKISLENGDCIIVSPIIKTLTEGRDIYIVNPHPPQSAHKDIKIETGDTLTAESNILGAVVAKIPAEWMNKYRRK